MPNSNTDEEFVDPEFEYWKNVPLPLRNTMLGHYLATYETRWLVAVMCYGAAYLLIAVTIITIMINFSDTKKAMEIFKRSAWVFTAACGLFAVGGFASYRLHVAIGTTIMFLLFFFFHLL